ncbi:MAG: hypothetical protein KC503_33990 [Myxococcales bacterium]|nr:hypothetical protein [Myxococcales bacterium]
MVVVVVVLALVGAGAASYLWLSKQKTLDGFGPLKWSMTKADVQGAGIAGLRCRQRRYLWPRGWRCWWVCCTGTTEKFGLCGALEPVPAKSTKFGLGLRGHVTVTSRAVDLKLGAVCNERVIAPLTIGWIEVAAPSDDKATATSWQRAAGNLLIKRFGAPTKRTGTGPDLELEWKLGEARLEVEGGRVRAFAPRHKTSAASQVAGRTASAAELARRRRVAQALRREIDGTPSDALCTRLSAKTPVPTTLCEALVKPIKDGRTTSRGRQDLRIYLRQRGYVRLRGYVVQEVRSNVYEIARSGRRLHALLKTNLTAYTTRGRFSLWAKKVGRVPIKTTNGFQQTWDVFREDAFGSVVEAVFNARAGDATREAARRALKALLAISTGGG